MTEVDPDPSSADWGRHGDPPLDVDGGRHARRVDLSLLAGAPRARARPGNSSPLPLSISTTDHPASSPTPSSSSSSSSASASASSAGPSPSFAQQPYLVDDAYYQTHYPVFHHQPQSQSQTLVHPMVDYPAPSASASGSGSSSSRSLPPFTPAFAYQGLVLNMDDVGREVDSPAAWVPHLDGYAGMFNNWGAGGGGEPGIGGGGTFGHAEVMDETQQQQHIKRERVEDTEQSYEIGRASCRERV